MQDAGRVGVGSRQAGIQSERAAVAGDRALALAEQDVGVAEVVVRRRQRRFESGCALEGIAACGQVTLGLVKDAQIVPARRRSTVLRDRPAGRIDGTLDPLAAFPGIHPCYLTAPTLDHACGALNP